MAKKLVDMRSITIRLMSDSQLIKEFLSKMELKMQGLMEATSKSEALNNLKNTIMLRMIRLLWSSKNSQQWNSLLKTMTSKLLSPLLENLKVWLWHKSIITSRAPLCPLSKIEWLLSRHQETSQFLFQPKMLSQWSLWMIRATIWNLQNHHRETEREQTILQTF